MPLTVGMTCLLVDFKSAYDLVWSENLLLMLSNIGVQLCMLKQYLGFLNNSLCRVHYNNCHSKFTSLKTKTGLIQEVVSSCTLFNIYINNLVSNLKSIPVIKCFVYSDDLVIWTNSPKSVAKQLIEHNLNKAILVLERYSEENNVKVNLENIFVQSFYLAYQPFQQQVFYRNNTIPTSENFKYLGVMLDRKLSQNLPAQDVINRASKRLSLLKILAGSKWNCSRSTLSQTFNPFVLLIMSCCCEALVTESKKIIDSIEKLLYQTMRLITGAVKFTQLTFCCCILIASHSVFLIRSSPCCYSRKLLEHLV